MSITYEKNEVTFTSVAYEDEIVTLRNFLQEKVEQEIKFNFIECEDIHLGVIQLILAYKKSYPCVYEFGNEKKLFETVLKGFDVSENYCN